MGLAVLMAFVSPATFPYVQIIFSLLGLLFLQGGVRTMNPRRMVLAVPTVLIALGVLFVGIGLVVWATGGSRLGGSALVLISVGFFVLAARENRVSVP